MVKGERLVDNQLAVDQSKEKTTGRTIEPAQMIKAGCANRVFPCIPGKPGKFIGRRPVIYTSGSLRKATDLVHDTGRIKKGMRVFTVYGNLPVQAGNNCPAGAAQNSFLYFAVRLITRVAVCLI